MMWLTNTVVAIIVTLGEIVGFLDNGVPETGEWVQIPPDIGRFGR